MQRSSVDLPEPDAPIRRSPRRSATGRSTWSSTTCSPNAFTHAARAIDAAAQRVGSSIIATAVPLVRPRSALQQVVGQPGQRDRDAARNSTRGADVRREVGVPAPCSICAWRSTSTGPSTLTQRRRPSAGSPCRSSAAARPAGTAWGSTTCTSSGELDRPSERAAARWLSCTVSMPARNTSDDVRGVRRGSSATEPQMTGLFHGRSMPQPGDAEADQVDQEDHGDAAHQVGVERRRTGAAGNSTGLRTLRAIATACRRSGCMHGRPRARSGRRTRSAGAACGNVARKTSPLKKLACTRSQPGARGTSTMIASDDDRRAHAGDDEAVAPLALLVRLPAGQAGWTVGRAVSVIVMGALSSPARPTAPARHALDRVSGRSPGRRCCRPTTCPPAASTCRPPSAGRAPR